MSLSTKAKKLPKEVSSKEVVKIKEKDDLFDPQHVLENIEILSKKQKKHLGRRQLAQAIHHQADSLKLKGDYETALILYHRAATFYPRDISHNIAVRHTSALIHSATNSLGALRKLTHNSRNSISLMPPLCPEIASQQAQHILHNSKKPYEDMTKILQYTDNRRSIIDKVHPKKRRMTRIIKSKMAMTTLNEDPTLKLYEMKRSFLAGDWKTTLNIGNELRNIIQMNNDQCCHRVACHRYMALSHLSMGRHDRATSEVAQMIQAAKKTDDEKLISRSFAVLGKIHLTFGHLNAAAKAWQRVLNDVNRPILKAWLFHEIGRCYFEMFKYSKALKISRQCINSSEMANSIKWLCYGKLLNGQALIRLGRLVEALEVFKFVKEKAKKQLHDLEIASYVENLIVNITEVLRKNSENQYNTIKDIENKSLSFHTVKKNLPTSTINVNTKSLIKLSKVSNSSDNNSYVTSRMVSANSKREKYSLDNIHAAKDNSIVKNKKTVSKSCHIIDKWKNNFCDKKKMSLPQFDLINSVSNDTKKLSVNTSARTQIIEPVGDTFRVRSP